MSTQLLPTRKYKALVKKADFAVDDEQCIERATSEFKNVASDPMVSSIKLTMDKNSGVIKLHAISFDGRVVTKEVLGPGLETATRYNGTSNTRLDRDKNIHTLLSKGLTQVEVAERLGISQALVSRVKNSR